MKGIFWKELVPVFVWERPELFIMPSASIQVGNFLPTPLEAIGLVDGSLRIELINDANNSRFNPDDQFSVHFSSTVSGIDFIEDYPFSFSPNNSWAGSAKSPTAGEPRLLIFPGDGNGTNFVEIPIGGTERNRNVPTITEPSPLKYMIKMVLIRQQ